MRTSPDERPDERRAVDLAARRRGILVLAGVVVVAFNLRTAITAVGPLVPTVRADLGVGNVAVGLVGTLPVLAFGLVAPLAPWLGRRLGIGVTLAWSMVLLTAATVLRSAGGYAVLVLGTVLVGVAVAVANVLVPALVKAVFPDRVGTMTSLYGAVMVLAATLAAGVAVPVAGATGWRLSLAVWAAPAALAAVVVAASLRADARAAGAEGQAREAAARRAQVAVPAAAMHRSSLAWHVTAFMGLQSLLFYVALAWLPDVLAERGFSEAAAGGLVSVLNVAGLVGILVAPTWAGRHGDQRWFGAASGVLVTVGVLLLLPLDGRSATAGVVVFGLGAGSTVGLALSFFSLRTTTPREAAAMSGMAQTWGYLVSALGPVAWGAMRDASSSWRAPLLALLAVAVATVVAGWAAGRDRLLALDGDG